MEISSAQWALRLVKDITFYNKLFLFLSENFEFTYTFLLVSHMLKKMSVLLANCQSSWLSSKNSNSLSESINCFVFVLFCQCISSRKMLC